MSANYCSSCGTELEQGVKFCPECGEEVSAGESNTAETTTTPTTESETPTQSEAPSNTMFRVTSGLIVGYFVFVLLGAAISSNALIGLGALCVLIALITMYVDLRDLEERLWETRPILWVIGALLLFVVIGPLYIYKRRQVA